MIVDPRIRRADRPPEDDGREPGLVELMGLGLELAPLRDLAGWDTVGSRIDAFVGAIGGSDGISRADVEKLRLWSRRWTALRAEIREFYVARVDAEDDAIRAILFRVLDGGDPLEGPQIGRLREAWLQHAGEPGDGLVLAPIPPKPKRTP